MLREWSNRGPEPPHGDLLDGSRHHGRAARDQHRSGRRDRDLELVAPRRFAAS